MAHPFIVGESYFDRKGNFVVLAIDKTTMRIRYEDGTEQTSDIAMKATIYRNILGEQRNLHPYQTPEYFETLGFLARQGDFQAEVPPQSEDGFGERYAMLTGVRPVLGNDGYYPVRTENPNDKWGAELRIYFPDRHEVNLPDHIEVRSGSADDTVRINNNAFWWQLVRVGFRLGTRHDVNVIRASIPPQFHADFDRGFNS
jgi:hypothetical protein